MFNDQTSSRQSLNRLGIPDLSISAPIPYNDRNYVLSCLKETRVEMSGKKIFMDQLRVLEVIHLISNEA